MNGEKVWAIWQAIKTITLTTIGGIAVIYFPSQSDVPIFVKYFTLVAGCLIIILGIVLAILKNIKSKIYICESCGHKFTPSIKSYFKGNKCPLCGSNSNFLKRDIP